MATYSNTFAQLTAAGNSAVFPCGDANDHTFVVKVAAINTSVDYNFQITINGADWANMSAANIQRTANGTYMSNFVGIHAMAVRVVFVSEVGGATVTLDVTYKGGE